MKIFSVILAITTLISSSCFADGISPSTSQSPLPMPFQRSGDPFLFAATTTPQQYMITQPPGTFSYRGVNPCSTADIRVKSVSATLPITTTSTPYPGVLKVTSPTGTVDATSGTRFVARSVETLGSTPDPISGPNRVISIMIVPIPGYSADLSSMTCVFELTYGNGG